MDFWWAWLGHFWDRLVLPCFVGRGIGFIESGMTRLRYLLRKRIDDDLYILRLGSSGE